MVTNFHCQDDIKLNILKLCKLLQVPPSITCLNKIPDIIKKLGIIHTLRDDVSHHVFLYLTSLECKADSSILYTGLKHPVFYALSKLNKKLSSPSKKQIALINQYLSIFNCEHLEYELIIGRHYYDDAYSVRDVILDETGIFMHIQDDFDNQLELIELVTKQIQFHLQGCQSGTTLHTKLTRFIELFHQTRLPGSKCIKEPAPSNMVTLNDGVVTSITYPELNGSDASKTLCRIPPISGSKLSFGDDRRALHGQINELAARNNPDITDMQRLPFMLISDYFTFLLPNNPEVFAYLYILIMTGLCPKKLERTKITKGKRKQSFSGCHINISTRILTYDVENLPHHFTKSIMQVQLPELITSYLSETKVLKNIKVYSNTIAKKYSEHSPGQTPTATRISNTAILLLSTTELTEIEIAYVSGHISPRLRAQAHYYPVHLDRINNELLVASLKFTNKYLLKYVRRKGLNLYLIDNSQPPLFGNIGSQNGLPIKNLQKILDQITHHAKRKRQEVQDYDGSFAIQKTCDFIQLQHLYLYILEQLGFCSRRFGEKTKYSASFHNNQVWGSEKASAIFSVERKLIPLNTILKNQLLVAQKDINYLTILAKQHKYDLKNSFNSRRKLLPIRLSTNGNLKTINLDTMNSANFHPTLAKYGIVNLPKPKLAKAHIFKHIVASELMGKVPQVLLDELMTHDRDGLDFYARWSTASTKSIDLLEKALCDMFNKLNIKVIGLDEKQ